MSTDDVSPVPRASSRREAPPAVTAMVRLISDTWLQASPYLPEMSQTFYGLLFTLAPDARELFPVNVEVRRGKLMRAIARVVQMVDRPEDLVPFLNQLGRDYRKYGVQSRHYEAIGTAMLAALRDQLGPAWTPDVERAWAEGFTIVARSMQEAAAADP
ncbi:MAG: globin domain-containing protein, partial [Thermocrispum sp.]